MPLTYNAQAAEKNNISWNIIVFLGVMPQRNIQTETLAQS